MLAECMAIHEIEWYREIIRLYDIDIVETFFYERMFKDEELQEI